MPVFQYTGTNSDGKAERGLMHGETMESVAKQLAEKGVTVEQLGVASSSQDPLAAPTEQSASFEAGIAGAWNSKVPLETLQFFFRQLGTLLNAGINGAEALTSLMKQASHPRLRQIVTETRDMAAAGKPISEGLARHPEVFSPLMVAMVRAGERGGFLSDQCGFISEYLRRDIELRNLIRKETIYPKIVVVASIFIIFGANTLIGSIGREGAEKIWSPLTTPANWILLTPIILLLLYYFKVVQKQPAARYKWDRGVLRIPFIGPTSHGFAMAKFGRSFGALYKAGVPIHEAVLLAADACGNEFIRARIYPSARALEGGEGITVAFTRTGVFTPLVLDMARTGEMTGDVDFMLIKMSEYYEEEGAVRARQAATVIGVAVFLAVAIYVAIVVIKFYTGYFSGIMSGA